MDRAQIESDGGAGPRTESEGLEGAMQVRDAKQAIAEGEMTMSQPHGLIGVLRDPLRLDPRRPGDPGGVNDSAARAADP